MSEIIKLILSLSISGSILVGLLLVMKPFIKHKLSKSLQYYIWIVVLLRLALPFSFEGSILNDVFNKNPFFTNISSQGENAINSNFQVDHSNSVILPNEEAGQTEEKFKSDAESSYSLMRLFEKYILYIWLFGVILSLTIKLKGYIRFSKYMKTTSKPAYDWENSILGVLLPGRNTVKLVCNSYVDTPMLIGIIRPTIIIPDTNFSEIQLRNILLHEITHLKRFDIVIKWFSMIVTSVHWFNPLMYYLEKEISKLCELSCDETVISNFSSSEKQQYGETLIAVASNERYPVGGLQVTFSDEKAILKERLMAIMRPSKKSKLMVLISIVIVSVVVFGAIALGASVGRSTPNLDTSKSPVEPPSIVISNERTPDPIDNYRILKSSWDGTEYDSPSFYDAAWHSEPTLLTGLRRLKPGEKLNVDFGSSPPDKVTVQMAYLTESYYESLLPIIEVPVMKVNGNYEFITPPTAVSDIQTTGRVFSITASWGKNSCEYVFASDGKFDSEEFAQ